MTQFSCLSNFALHGVLLTATFWFVCVGPRVADAQVVHFSEDSFDKATFSQLAVLQARQECLDALNDKMGRIASVEGFSAEDQAKLLTAGRVDIHRFFAGYAAFKGQIEFGNIARDQWQQVSVETRATAKPYTQRFLEGLHGQGSIMDRLLNRLATPEQIEQVNLLEREAAFGEFAEQIDAALLVVGRQVPLTVERREEIKDLLMEKTSPPTLFGASLMPLYFVLARMGQIESDLRPMFTEKDWPAVKKLIDAGVMATE